MCKVLKVSKSGYYKWFRSVPSKRTVENRNLTEQIKQVHLKSNKTYGSPRIAYELKLRKVNVSRPRVARLMRKAGIRSKLRRKYVVTTDTNHTYKVAENLLDRQFNVGSIGKVWVSDISYIKTAQGWLYLTVIIDLGDRKVIGWSLSKSLKAKETVIPAWNMAKINRPITGSMIFHSDRGVQYACTEFTGLLNKNKFIRQSMSRKGNCWDNAVAESFFKTLKAEWTNWNKYKTYKEAELSVFEYIETWYNVNRRHSALGFLTPAEYENYLLTKKLAA